jgi:hypothetical protein
LRNGILEEDDLKETYKTTEEGLRLLEICNRINEIVDTNKPYLEYANPQVSVGTKRVDHLPVPAFSITEADYHFKCHGYKNY